MWCSAEAVSHEAGHQLGQGSYYGMSAACFTQLVLPTGLTHMGVFADGVFETYYQGANQHSVIMGSAYGKHYSLWSKVRLGYGVYNSCCQ